MSKRRLIVFLFGFMSAVVPGYPAQVRITTLDFAFASTNSTVRPPGVALQKTLQDSAGQIKGLNPDVILLAGVRNRPFCERLAELLRPARYYVLACSAFADPESGMTTGSQVAILSKSPAIGAWAEAWRPEGGLQPAGGIAFAAVRFGTVDVGFYAVRLRDGRTRANAGAGSAADYGRERELAARQLAGHVAAVEPKLSNPAFVVTGDFSAPPGLVTSDRTMRTLEAAGFRNLLPITPSRTGNTAARDGRAPAAAASDYLLTRNADLIDDGRIGVSRAVSRPLVTCQLAIPAAGAASARALLPLATESLRTRWRTPGIWLGAGMLMVVLVVVRLVVRRGRRPRAAKTALVGFADAYSLGRAPVSDGSFKNAFREDSAPPKPAGTRGTSAGRRTSRGEPNVFKKAAGPVPWNPVDAESTRTASTAGSADEAAFWRSRALEAERNAERSAAVVRSGLFPHLARFLQDNLLRRVLAQRSELIETQRTGAQLLTEFERRLGAVQLQFQARLQACERHIEELHREIAARECELTQLRAGAAPPSRPPGDA